MATQFITPLQKTSFSITRQLMGIDDALSEEDAVAQINPAMIEVIMQIIAEVLKNCPQPSASWNRLQIFARAKPINRLGADNIILNRRIDGWLSKLGAHRTTGDVVAVREAVIAYANGMQQTDFTVLQNEVLFMGI